MHNNEMETTEKPNYVPTFNNKMEDKEEWKMKMQAIQNEQESNVGVDIGPKRERHDGYHSSSQNG